MRERLSRRPDRGLVSLVWQVAVMWLFHAGRLLARWAARVSDYAADRTAHRATHPRRVMADHPGRGLSSDT